MNNTSDVSPECETAEIKGTVRASVVLDKLVKNRNLGSLVYYYEGESLEGPVLQIGNTDSHYHFSTAAKNS